VALPLTLPLHLLGLTGHGAAQRYVELLQVRRVQGTARAA
jgi:hypothetical protein